MCMHISIAIMNGSTKCKLKNLANVALLIENPPHIQKTNSSPIKGTTVIKLVITVAAQKLI